MSIDNSVSLILSIYNQESIIATILTGILKNVSSNVKELLIIIDGCTDQTDAIVKSTLKDYNTTNIPVKLIYADNVWEVKANNIGFKASQYPWILTIQDDMLIQEKDFDVRMLKPFGIVDNLLGVTGRSAQDETITPEGKIQYLNVFGKDRNSPKNIFGIRDIIVRGPIMFNHEKLAQCDYLNEEFAPIDGDEKDLCFRAYKKFNYVVGAYVVDYVSHLQWGKTRNDYNSNQIWAKAALAHIDLLIEKHRDALLGEKHDQDIQID